jgi:uncharacterized membrane protein YjgN (DUF898 family)
MDDATVPRTERIEFTGDGAEYFRIWIVNLALTIVTVGIYSAWAKVRRLRYFYGSTRLAGAVFEYHGQPLQILKGRLIAVAFLVPYAIFNRTAPLVGSLFALALLFLYPFVIVRSRQFHLRMSSWRNLRFGFDSTYGGAVKIYLLLPLLVGITLGLYYPAWHRAKDRFLTANSRYGTTHFEFDAKTGGYYAAYALTSLVFLGALVALLVVYGVLGAAGALAGLDVFKHLLTTTDPVARTRIAMMLGVTVWIFIVPGPGLLAAAMFRVRTLNVAQNGISLAGNRVASSLAFWSFYWLLLSNLLLIVVTLGLFTPWATVRVARYQFEHLQVQVNGSLDQFVAAPTDASGAAGEGFTDLLNVDFGL